MVRKQISKKTMLLVDRNKFFGTFNQRLIETNV